MRKVLRTLIVLFALIAAGLVIYSKLYFKKAEILPEMGRVDDFSLTDQTGATVTRDSLKGRPWIASFIFTRCMGPCPLITNKASELQKEFPGSKLTLVSFSVDPAFDTPAVLTAYAATYHADSSRWHFLTGDKKKIFSLIRSSFHLAIENDRPNDPDAILHSTMFIWVDANGIIRGYYNSTDPDSMAKLKMDLHQRLGV